MYSNIMINLNFNLIVAIHLRMWFQGE